MAGELSNPVGRSDGESTLIRYAEAFCYLSLYGVLLRILYSCPIVRSKWFFKASEH